jgi:hypothetical protein
VTKTFATALLIALGISLSGCSVVPDPTPNGVDFTSTDSTFVGNWIATSYATSTSGSVVTTSTYTHYLSIAEGGSRYTRWVYDSTPGTAKHPALIEDGTWSDYTSDDTARLVLVPTYRLLTTVATNAPDTVVWSVSSGTLHWVGPRWNQRDTVETLNWAAN